MSPASSAPRQWYELMRLIQRYGYLSKGRTYVLLFIQRVCSYAMGSDHTVVCFFRVRSSFRRVYGDFVSSRDMCTYTCIKALNLRDCSKDDGLMFVGPSPSFCYPSFFGLIRIYDPCGAFITSESMCDTTLG